jgi:LysM repeat protein
MKIWSVFSLVILFHFVVIGLLFIQPGCQSQPPAAPDPSLTAPPADAAYVEPQPQQQLDPAFNAGVSSQGSAASSGRQLSAPQRPTGSTGSQVRSTPDTGLLEPVRDPVTDSFSLPPVNREYTVQKGDTLSGIARKEGVSLSELMSANGLGRNSTIYVGQNLLIPEAGTREDTASMETEYSGKEVTVGRGDTLSAIAARNGTTVREIKALNGLTGDTIYVGQKLMVPGSGQSTTTTAPRTTSTPSSFSGSTTTYTVKAGDTPSGIARRYGITSRELMAANNITDARRLYVGRELVVPQQSGSSTPAPAQPSVTPPPAPRQQQPAMQSPSRPDTGSTSAATSPDNSEEDDPMAALEALEDEDLPFVEVEVLEEPTEPAN